MKENIWERYGPYPKKKAKKRIRMKEGGFLKRSHNWLKWRVDKTGGVMIYHPCLEH
jgi:hypothetical protein